MKIQLYTKIKWERAITEWSPFGRTELMNLIMHDL